MICSGFLFIIQYCKLYVSSNLPFLPDYQIWQCIAVSNNLMNLNVSFSTSDYTYLCFFSTFLNLERFVNSAYLFKNHLLVSSILSLVSASHLSSMWVFDDSTCDTLVADSQCLTVLSFRFPVFVEWEHWWNLFADLNITCKDLIWPSVHCRLTTTDMLTVCLQHQT